MYLTIHLNRLETESQNQTHQTHPNGGGNGRTERFSICSGGWERIRIFFREEERCRKRERKRERFKSHTRLPKNFELFAINLALCISLSPIQVFNLKSARRNRWVAPFLSLHKVPALSSSLPNRRVPLFLPYFPRIPLHQRTFTRHRISRQCPRVRKHPRI